LVGFGERGLQRVWGKKTQILKARGERRDFPKGVGGATAVIVIPKAKKEGYYGQRYCQRNWDPNEDTQYSDADRIEQGSGFVPMWAFRKVGRSFYS